MDLLPEVLLGVVATKDNIVLGGQKFVFVGPALAG
jgi:hypothetical protein